MGNKPHKNSTAGWPMRVLRTLSKITVRDGYRAFVMELTVSKRVNASDGSANFQNIRGNR